MNGTQRVTRKLLTLLATAAILVTTTTSQAGAESESDEDRAKRLAAAVGGALADVGAGAAIVAAAAADLEVGDQGSRVVDLQEALTRHGYVTPVDGDFGDKTLGKVKAFQAANGLTPDGVVGLRTKELLNQPPTTGAAAVGGALADVGAGAAIVAAAAADLEGGVCPSVAIVFVRGSSQKLGDREATKFLTEMAEAIEAGGFLTYSTDEIDYPAIAVSEAAWNYFMSPIKLPPADGSADSYYESAVEGVESLFAFVQGTYEQCPSTDYVIGGYSQGAEVVRYSLQWFDRPVRDRIKYIALFGDPTMKGGILDDGSGSSAVPPDLKYAVNEYCNENDLICRGFFDGLGPNSKDPHDTYASRGGAIESAASVVRRLAADSCTWELGGRQRYTRTKLQCQLLSFEAAS